MGTEGADEGGGEVLSNKLTMAPYGGPGHSLVIRGYMGRPGDLDPESASYMAEDGREFRQAFVASFLGQWVMSRFDECCARGKFDLLTEPPVEEAEHLGLVAWDEYLKVFYCGAPGSGVKEEEGSRSGLCPGCEKNEAAEPHSCRFQREIHDNHKVYCTCCAECEDECAMDI